jgi:hypothetical protein
MKERPGTDHPNTIRAALEQVGLAPPVRTRPESPHRFEDGARYRVEIASVEGPAVLRAMIDEARSQNVRIDRVSQGSGVMMLSDADLEEMAELGRLHHIDICLFLSPRAEWDAGGQALVNGSAAGIARGPEAVEASVADALRACRHGIRSLLVSDIGVLDVLARLRAQATLPPDLRFKTSVVMGIANPATAGLLDRLGADTLNLATDLDLDTLAAIRQVTRKPIDVYVEVPDDLGGFVRWYLVPDLIRVAAPVHVKFGLRNATSVYPSGLHLDALASAQVREKVRRAALVERLIAEIAPDLARGLTPGA